VIARGQALHVEVTVAAGDRWRIAVHDRDAAEARVRELGFGRTARPVRYELGSATQRLLHPLAVGVSLGLSFWLFAIMLPAAALFVWPYHVSPALRAVLVGCASFLLFPFAAAFLREPVITLGADGLWLEKRRFSRRFVPLEDIVAVTVKHGRPALRLSDGKEHTIGGALVDLARRDAFVRDLGALLAARAERSPHQVLERQGRSIQDWRAHIAGVVRGGSYRAASVGGRLADALSAPGTALEARVGAALAMRVAGEVDAPARIRLAAEQCADPAGRAALEAVAADDLDEPELENALRLAAPHAARSH
jgi:hypothetical protein